LTKLCVDYVGLLFWPTLQLLLTSASLAVVDGSIATSIEPFLAVVTVSSIGVVTTLDTDSATDVTRQLVQFHVEATLTSVLVTVAR